VDGFGSAFFGSYSPVYHLHAPSLSCTLVDPIWGYNTGMGLRLAPIESKATWEEFLLFHAPQSLFQSWLWGEVEKKAETAFIE
jgi:hypothetical protein